MYNYDSEGDSFEVTSKSWTELYICSREDEDLCFDIWKVSDDPLMFLVSSKTWEIVNIIAYLLARETNGEIIDTDGTVVSPEDVTKRMGDFDLPERLRLADDSLAKSYRR